MASETLAKIDRAYDVVSALCEGKREWLMGIPARPDHDPDLIIGDALLAARNEIARLTREMEAARERERALTTDAAASRRTERETMSETKLDPRDRLAVMVSMAGSYIESGRGDDALAVMRTVAEDVATEIARLTRELEEARESSRR